MNLLARFSCVALAGAAFLGVALAGEGAAPPKTPVPGLLEKPRGEQQVPLLAVKKKPAAPKFVRLLKDKKGKPLALQTAVFRYVPAQGDSKLVVDLVGAVHIGDRAYYSKLNKHFEQYDAVLYELVAAEGNRIPQDRRNNGDNPLSFLQKAMRMILALDSQLECVDYTCTNFVHADLSPEEMFKAIEKRGDTPLTLTLSIAADLLREQNLKQMQLEQNPQQGEDFDPLGALLDPQGPNKLKAVMAEQLAGMSDSALGKTINTILIDDRNAACMKVFQKELVNGKTKLAIFYGAAHMPDFDRRLRELGLRRQSIQWFTAWDLRPRQMNLLDLIDRFGR